jgi:hypothetical protein
MADAALFFGRRLVRHESPFELTTTSFGGSEARCTRREAVAIRHSSMMLSGTLRTRPNRISRRRFAECCERSCLGTGPGRKPASLADEADPRSVSAEPACVFRAASRAFSGGRLDPVMLIDLGLGGVVRVLSRDFAEKRARSFGTGSGTVWPTGKPRRGTGRGVPPTTQGWREVWCHR